MPNNILIAHRGGNRRPTCMPRLARAADLYPMEPAHV